MIVLAAAPLLVGTLAAWWAPRLAARMRPAAATVLLVGLALSVALATGAMLCLVAAIGLVEAVPALRPSDWSLPVLLDSIPVPGAVAGVAGLVAAALLVNAGAHLLRVVRAFRRTAREIERMPGAGGLTVVDGDTAQAYAVPGLWRTGRVVVSRALLHALTATQRRALLAHERAHLRLRHHLFAQAVRLATKANPLLRPLVPAVDVALERWADAHAVRAVGDPRTVVEAMAVAAHGPAPAGALGAGTAVVTRARYLLDPPRPPRAATWLALAATLACWASVLVVVAHVHGVVELSEVALLHQ